MNLHALFHLLEKKTMIMLITVTGTVHAEHTANDLVERNSTAVLVRVVSEWRCMGAYLIDIHFRSGNICWFLFPPSDADVGPLVSKNSNEHPAHLFILLLIGTNELILCQGMFW